MPENQFYEFGPFILDTVQHLLLKGQEPVTLTPKTYDALLVLVRNSGRMLSKEELMAALWPESFVEESNLTQQVSMIRKALGESPGQDRYIVTVPGRGYRFAAQVRAWSKEKPPATADRPELVARVEGTGKQEERPSLTLAASEKVLRMESRVASKLGAAPELEISKTTTDPESVSIAHQAGEKGKKRRARIAIAVLVLLMIALVVGYFMYRKRASRPADIGGTTKPGHSSVSESPSGS